MAEYEGIKVVKKIERIYRGYRIQEDVPRITIQFDVALVLKTVIHRNVPSPFAAEAYACLEGTKLGIALRTQSSREETGTGIRIEEMVEGVAFNTDSLMKLNPLGRAIDITDGTLKMTFQQPLWYPTVLN
ncbi:hypothetical protein Gotri_008100 [Gossypium trilobum]|uniref:Uncharacterized protein n=1 Tax=Gossypium trilobum TaxID=34281 RepID=A0A7J9EJW9_9ROSI|nr:hypothetical protein [Gossypium trilobum]